MNNLLPFDQHRTSPGKEETDLMVIFNLIFKNWYWFVIAVFISITFAYVYIKHTLPVYRSSATLLINEAEERNFGDNTELLQGLGLPGAMKNLQNQILIIKSRQLIEGTLKDLPFEIEYYFKTLRNRLPIYPESPIRVVSDGENPLPKDTEFEIIYLGNKMFRLESNEYPLLITASFGESVDTQAGSFRVECNDDEWINRNKDRQLCFKIHSYSSLVNDYANRINVNLDTREGSILTISLEGTNKKKDVDFLNNHLEGFQSLSLDKKNEEAIRRIQFIDDQLIGISDSLSTTENRLQQFRSSHRVMDLSAQGQSIIAQVTLLENERARLNLEASYYDYLADYLSKDATAEIPLVPITMGITDAGLTRLVEELAELQGQLLARGAGEMNPLQRSLEQKVQTTKSALRETLNGLRRANSLARSEKQEQINKANSQASALPITERQLLGIERKFKLNDELYTFLLETRAEQELQKASNRPDCEIIDHADPRFSYIVAPNPLKINLVALALGLVVPFFVLYFHLLFNNKIKDEDVKIITDMPVIGNIPHRNENTSLIVLQSPNSSISEAFRLLRSRMQFLTKDAGSPVIIVTSSMPGDGKTFTAINLASAYSLMEKKTVLIGFDLRKPKIWDDFKLSNERGVSTWLIGKDTLDDIIQETQFNNLFIIPSGPVPPNPSELTALGKNRELLGLLKKKFEYIIIDTSPIGIVSDTFTLASLADACLLVVRSGKTLRDLFEKTLIEINASNLSGFGIVVNDIKSDNKHYGYGSKYGYTTDHGKGKWHFRKTKVSLNKLKK